MLPELDLPEGISVAPDEEHDYIIEVWRQLPPNPRFDSIGFGRLGFIDTFSGHVHLDDGSRQSTPSRDPQTDVDWVLRQVKAPKGPDGRAVGYLRA
jgi:hypothetical protein